MISAGSYACRNCIAALKVYALRDLAVLQRDDASRKIDILMGSVTYLGNSPISWLLNRGRTDSGRTTHIHLRKPRLTRNHGPTPRLQHP